MFSGGGGSRPGGSANNGFLTSGYNNQSNFFLNSDTLLNDDEELNDDNVIEYDDDKNDETFGGEMDNGLDWEQSDISNQSQQLVHMFKNDNVQQKEDLDDFVVGERDDDYLDTQVSSVIQFAIDDDQPSPSHYQHHPQHFSRGTGPHTIHSFLQPHAVNVHDLESQLKSTTLQPHPYPTTYSNQHHLLGFPYSSVPPHMVPPTQGGHPLPYQQPPSVQQQQLPSHLTTQVQQQQQERSVVEEEEVDGTRSRSSSIGSPNISGNSNNNNRRTTSSGYYLNLIYNTYNPKQLDTTYNVIHRRLFPDTKLMSAEEIEAIVRQQMQDLQIKNPFVDDFYYCSMTNKKSIDSRRINANFANWIHEGLSLYQPRPGKTEEELRREEQMAQQPRVFGRIPSQNVRAPRAMFEIEQELKDLQNSPYSMSTLRRDMNAQLNLLIENGLMFLIQIQEFSLCMRNIQNTMSQQSIHEYFGLCQLVTRMLNLPSQQQHGFTFYQILEKRKGIKFVSKALQYLPEPFIVHLLKSVLLCWELILQFISKHEDAEELKQRFIKDTQIGICNLSLVAICQILHDDPSRDNIIDIRYPTLFGSGGFVILTTLLKRAADLVPSDPQSVGAWRSDFSQLFKALRLYGFVRIASSTEQPEEAWKLLEMVLSHCNEEQTRAITDDLRQFLIQQPTPSMTGFLQRLMSK